MDILVLGGTSFSGRHLVRAAVQAGHRVATFTRGKTNPGAHADVEDLRGARDGDLGALEGRRWDAVVDMCGFVPRVVRASAELLVSSGHYTFVSSISVFASFETPGMDESAPLGTLEDPATEQVTGETYGPLKARCEDVVREVFAGRSIVVRPGLIVGPFDPTDRFTYWPRRVARGGDVLAPGSPGREVQFIDGRDLAGWILRMVERGGGGTFNATGPRRPETMGKLLDACRAASGSDARPVWVDEAFLLERGVEPWSELPLWVPDTAEHAGFSSVDCGKAVAEGLTFRPTPEIVRDTIAWDATRPAGERPGMTEARERELLGEWAARAT